MQSIIGITKEGTRFINYDSSHLNLLDGTEYVTIKELPEQVIEAIKEATFEDVNNLLSNYI